MIKVILIDDEHDALEVLEWQLQNYCPDVEVLALCQSVDEGIRQITALQPDLIFLDIEMPVKNGFDLLNAFDDPKFAVIFTTAYNQYAVKAIRVAAFDYLVKPIDSSDLKTALSRFSRTQDGTIKDRLKGLMDEYFRPATSRVALHTAEGMLMVTAESIIRCMAISNYTKIFLKDEKSPVVVTRTLGEVEDILGTENFYRVHNSHLVNLSHIERYVRNDGGYVVMSDGEEISIARNRKDGFMEQFARI
jgi:two-component system LytT family response regulator